MDYFILSASPSLSTCLLAAAAAGDAAGTTDTPPYENEKGKSVSILTPGQHRSIAPEVSFCLFLGLCGSNPTKRHRCRCRNSMNDAQCPGFRGADLQTTWRTLKSGSGWNSVIPFRNSCC
ncbi:hypothetical protein CEXT_53351 [Caerostris extrusa]|uniref:Secreted protein n=1 Tax=Caerostris extrusa TaxID=172846 RepID=A0AAV4URB4_CAEEX|nr:hypothetical protein CEXT_53351 [Caerostris extrusa]